MHKIKFLFGTQLITTNEREREREREREVLLILKDIQSSNPWDNKQ